MALAAAGAILLEGWKNGWQAPAGSVRPEAYLMGYGAAPFIVAIALALLLRLVLSRGVAVAREQSELVLEFPFRRKRIPLTGGMTIFAEERTIDLTRKGALFRVPPIYAKQVVFCRAGFPDLPFRTGLLTESADLIARRISEEVQQGGK